MTETGLLVFFLFCLGAAIGSFLHVVAERYGTGLSFSKGNSLCPQCKKALSARELIPLFSYIFSRAECKGCRAEIPAHYAISELLTGLLAVVLLLHGNILLFLAACILVILIRIDSRLMLLPDTYIYLLIGISIAYALRVNADFTDIVFGMLAGAGSLYLLWIGTLGRGLGFGDVKLMIPLGILFGLRGTVALLFFSFFAGGIVSIFLLVSGRVTPKTAIPFGPFLAGAALLLMVFPGLTDRFFIFLGVY
ncbi:MAG: prepilin peptidase [bacterium]|nr:prepilin peptidase [bacterium]